jgi:phosphohistidine phosphatase
MKSLILLRHAKSDWTEEVADHDRPLAPRGIKAARVMGRFLQLAEQVPDSVIVSSAVRARTTVELAAEAGAWACPVRVTRAIYEATPFQVLEEIRREPDATETLLVGGHEPTTSELATLLLGGGVVRVPTAFMARIDLLAGRWQDVGHGRGSLVWAVPPKLFTKGSFGFASKAAGKDGAPDEGDAGDDAD